MIIKKFIPRIIKHSNKVKITFSIFFVLILYFNFFQPSSFELMKNLHIQVILLLIILTIFTLIIRALRWKYMIRLLGYEIRLKNSIQLYAVGIYYGSISPAKLGEFIKVYHLKDYNIPYNEGFGSIIYERFFDIALAVAVVGQYFFLTPTDNALYFVFIAFLLTTFLWFGFMLSFGYCKKMIPYLKTLKNIPINNVRPVLMSGLFTILNGVCFATIAFVILCSFDIHVNFLYVLFSVSIATLSSLLPITFGGWGVREGIYITMLSSFALPSDIILFSVVFVIFTTYLIAIIGLLFELVIGYKKPLTFHNGEKT
ncbi:MAG: flippase-like domain-containing protein [Crenarchaeota archaeon]|nr:flippase-like domain-containing protein [Thermoproteota archaeon]